MDFIFQIHLLYKHCVFKGSSAYSRGNKDGESTKSLWISYPDHKRLKIERQDFELALNCPGHCLIFDRRVRSYRAFAPCKYEKLRHIGCWGKENENLEG
ncbi:uncharacterized protein LOC131311362 isoform X6 [Rhododendron vialii]|nr:uncharacterized protein LOC131311362 isoform X6 [Rhododendron vialii]